MLRRSCAALSPKLKSNTHPKNTVRWRTKLQWTAEQATWKPVSGGFYKPHYGASKMKWHFQLPYRRDADSLHHFPEVSKVTGKPINWYHDEPTDGYDGVRHYGEHTLELKGMPMGRTPEYMQERLRRFFSKFGPVQLCRAEPHPLDPYQCEGTAYVTFRERTAALKALRAPLKFPASLHDKVVSMRHLDSDKRNDPDYFEKSKFWNNELVSVARQLHAQLSACPELRADGKPLSRAGFGLLERELVASPQPDEALLRGRGGVPLTRGGLVALAPTRQVSAQAAVMRRFRSWELFLSEAPFDELFSIGFASKPGADMGEAAAGDGEEGPEEVASGDRKALVVRPRLVSTTQRARILARARLTLAKRLHDEFSVWWREGKVKLPEYTQRRVDWWDHKPPLPFELQIQSRSKDRHRIFDEKFLYRMQLKRARNERRRERRAEWTEVRKERLDEKDKTKRERQTRALEAVSNARCGGLLGDISPSRLPQARR